MTERSRLPNFLFLGPDKSGSTWLHEALSTHPSVFLAPTKDLYFFDRYYERGLPWYASQFANASRSCAIIGEVCHDYLFSIEARDRIRADLGLPRLMVSLRDPVGRAFSAYRNLLRHGWNVGSFDEALATHSELIEHGRYGRALSRYLEVFPRELIYVGVFEDLQADPQQYLDGIADFLEIDRLVLSEEATRKLYAAATPRHAPSARLAKAVAVWLRNAGAEAAVGRVKRSSIVRSALYRESSSAQVPEPASARLIQEELREDVQLLTELTQIPFGKIWGWPGLGAKAENML